LEALFPERAAGHRAHHQSHHLVEKSVRRKFDLEQVALASDPDVFHRPHGTSFFFSAICGKGGEIMPANEEFGRSPKRLPIKRRGDMPCPADLQRRSDGAIYDPVTINFTLRRKSSVKAFRDKSRLQNPNRWRQHAV